MVLRPPVKGTHPAEIRVKAFSKSIGANQDSMDFAFFSQPLPKSLILAPFGLELAVRITLFWLRNPLRSRVS